MDLPLGFEMHLKGKKVCKIEKRFVWVKAISMGLIWKICEVMITIDYQQNHDDCTLFIKHLAFRRLIDTPVHMNDLNSDWK